LIQFRTFESTARYSSFRDHMNRERQRILIVDDDVALCELVKRVLDRAGYTVTYENSGEKAKETLRNDTPDLMLLDLKLADTDAEQFLAEISAEAPPPPFVVITGQGDERVAVQMMKLGALDYLLKDAQFIHFLMGVVERALAQVEIRWQLERLECERQRLERELLEISERERRTVGHDLHDGLGQRLTALSLMSHALCENLQKERPDLLPRAQQINLHIRETIAETRRIAHGLAPVSLDAGGLADALRQLAETSGQGGAIRCTFDCAEPVEMADEEMGIHLYRIAQEAVANALKHSGATHIRIELDRKDRHVRLQISDDGSGLAAGYDREAGMGLRVMDFRARLLGGGVTVESSPKRGVCIRCICPESLERPELAGKTAKT
jgi:signal transduction histidine kinase